MDDRLGTRAVHNRKLRKQNTTSSLWLEETQSTLKMVLITMIVGGGRVMGMTTVFEWLRKRNRSVATAAVIPPLPCCSI